MDVRCLEEFVVGVYFVEQSFGVGVVDFIVFFYYFSYVIGYIQGWSVFFFLVFGWGQFDIFQVQSGIICNNKI